MNDTMRRALVTGGSGDLGGSICRALHAAGCFVYVHANRGIERAEALVAELGDRAAAIAFDVSDGEASRMAVESLLADGPIQVVVNNAGIHDDAPMAGCRGGLLPRVHAGGRPVRAAGLGGQAMPASRWRARGDSARRGSLKAPAMIESPESSPRPRISVVVLCYRAGDRARGYAGEVVARLEEAVDHWEIVLVGNYVEGDTSDTTPAVVRETAGSDPRIKAVAVAKRGRMGWDARQGFAAATGDTIALIDGDGQVPARDLVRVYRALRDGGFDMVKTYRTERRDGVIRRLNSDAYNVVYRFLFPGFAVRDVNSKPKIFTRSFFERLTLESDDWFLDAEIMIQARRLRCRMAEIPTTFADLEGRRSFVRVRHIAEFLRNLAIARVKEFFV